MTNLINYLALQTIQISDSGLYHGRMGLILSLYCYGKVNNNQRLCDYASNILQDTADEYYDGDISLEDGLSGLGLGYSLLYKAGMFNDNLNDILYEIDKKIMSIDPRRMEDKSFRRGALGLLFYIQTRLSIGQECVSLQKDYIRELEASLYEKARKPVERNSFILSIRQPEWKRDDYLDKEVGIDKGTSFFLLNESYDKVFSC